jgi:hypothetical protein
MHSALQQCTRLVQQEQQVQLQERRVLQGSVLLT